MNAGRFSQGTGAIIRAPTLRLHACLIHGSEDPLEMTAYAATDLRTASFASAGNAGAMRLQTDLGLVHRSFFPNETKTLGIYLVVLDPLLQCDIEAHPFRLWEVSSQ